MVNKHCVPSFRAMALRARAGELAGDIAGVLVLVFVAPLLVGSRRERWLSAGDGRRRRNKDRSSQLPVGDASVSGDRRRHERRARRHAEAILGVIELRSLSVRSKSIRLCEVKSQALWMRNVAGRSSDGDLGHGGRSNNRRRRSRS